MTFRPKLDPVSKAIVQRRYIDLTEQAKGPVLLTASTHSVGRREKRAAELAKKADGQLTARPRISSAARALKRNVATVLADTERRQAVKQK